MPDIKKYPDRTAALREIPETYPLHQGLAGHVMKNRRAPAAGPPHPDRIADRTSFDSGMGRVPTGLLQNAQETAVPTLQVDGVTVAVIDHPTAYKLLEAGKRKIGTVRPPDPSSASTSAGTRSIIAPAQTFVLTVDFP